MKARTLLFIGLCVLSYGVGPALAWAQAESVAERQEVVWPDTPAGRCAQAFFDALATEGTDALRRFVEERYGEDISAEEKLASHLQLRNLAGELTPHVVSSDDDYAVVVWARSALFGWMKFSITLSPDPPHCVTAMRGEPGAPPEAEGPVEYADWRDLGELLEQVRRDSGAPGVVGAIVRGGQIVDSAATGVRRIDRPDEVRIGDLFHIGSLTKPFTGTMIAKLIENGALRWDLTIGEVLADVAMKPEYRSVTLEQLLGHRGGIPSLPTTGEFAEGFPNRPGQLPAQARAALVRQVLTEASTLRGEYSYSNAGYVVAAVMVERATGRSWEEQMQTLVFAPIGLRSTGFGWPATAERPNQPRGHYGSPPELTVQEIGEYMMGDMKTIGPAGNLHCSIEDLARFAAYQLSVLAGNESTLRAETVPRFWKSGAAEHGERMFSFFGSGGTFMAMIALYPDSDLGIVAATNYGLPAMPFLEKMRDAIHQRLATPSDESEAAAELEWPKTVAAHRAKAFVNALNAGSEESLRRFIVENYSPASLEREPVGEQIAPYAAIHAQMGRLIVNSVEPEGEFRIVILGKSEALGMWVKFTLEVEEEPPYYWAGWTGHPTAAP